MVFLLPVVVRVRDAPAPPAPSGGGATTVWTIVAPDAECYSMTAIAVSTRSNSALEIGADPAPSAAAAWPSSLAK
ncbi:MAG: hypothetical protein RI885_1438 [Actinomycetota bacterium]